MPLSPGGGRPGHAPLEDDLRADPAGLRVDEEMIDVGLLLDDALPDPVRRRDDVAARPVPRVAGERDERARPGDHPLDPDGDPGARWVGALQDPVADGLGLERRRPAARHRRQEPGAGHVQEAVAHPRERVVLAVLGAAVLPRHRAGADGRRPAGADERVERLQEPVGEVAGRHGPGQGRRRRGAPVRGGRRGGLRERVPQGGERPVELVRGQAEEAGDGEARRAQRLQPRELVADLAHGHHTFGRTRGVPAAYCA
nr:hypothetical protein [Actinomadura madurae]